MTRSNLIRSLSSAAVIAALFLSSLAVPGQENGEPEADDKEKKGLPLKPERKVEFTTDEGTWMSVDVSPDGSTLVFDLLGDLYTIPAEGGKATRVTSGMGFDAQPRYSPNGEWLAFVSDRNGSNNVWISKADGSEAKVLTKEEQAEFVSPEWTPDGDFIVVSKTTPQSSGAELWMYHRLGGTGLKISKGGPRNADSDGPPPPGPSYYGAVVSANWKYIFFARQAPRSGPRLNVPDCQIIRRDVNAGEEDQITFEPGNAFRPELSPDGSKLVFGTRYEGKTGLKVRDLRTGEERWLKYPVLRDEQESRPTRDLLPGYSFLPDGNAIVVSYGGKFYKVELSDGKASQIPFTADISLEIGPSLYVDHKLAEGPVKARLVQEPEFAPDGKRIAFSALGALYTQNLENGSPERLTDSREPREFQPSFSPDGRWIAFVTWSTKGGHIWKTDGNSVVRVTGTPAFFRDPVWSPDGTRIFALRASRPVRVNHPSDFLGAQPGLDIVSVPSDGGEASVVIPSRGLGKPHFGPERDRVYVYGDDGLVSYRFDGSDRKLHLKVLGKSRRGRPNPARDVRISPDGKMAMALLTSQLYVFPVLAAGAEPPEIDVSKPPVPVSQLTNIGADSFAWADGGKTLSWVVGSTIYTQPLSSVNFEEEKEKDKKKEDKGEEDKSDEKKEEPKDPPPYAEREISVERERYVPKGTVVLSGAKAITMNGDEVIENSVIVVTDNRIKAIGKRGLVPIPDGARVIDVRGKTIIPGIIDVHAHWEVRHQVLDTEDYTFWGNLAYGVTTGRDPQTNTNDTFAYQDLVDTGDMIGPRIFTTGPGIFSDTDFKSYEQARDTIARYKRHYRAETLKSYLVGNRKQRQWVAMASKELGIIPTTEGGSDLKLNLTHAIDGFAGNEHSLPVVPLFKDVIELFARTKITYTPTLLVSYGGPQGKFYFFEASDVYGDEKLKRFNPQAVLDEKTARLPWFRESEYIFPEIAKFTNEIYLAGGRVGIGGHGELQGLQCHWEMWALGMGGMKPHDILKVATTHGAEAIGFGSELGSLEPGKAADLVVLDKDPLSDIRNTNSVRYVMKNGEMYEGDTLDRIWPDRKPLPEAWWWEGKPAGSNIR
ncbi:MAG: amidohydrolase [Acidobacteria bacterium]|nr:MAG: amidohydrolase [Acidobacteriota bacterium]REJ98822.1 MAG: amidohydrolase [Acidobacteriota bacterium]REK16458.1 MAG: amidohydrolase [Acidobacteriota bacterium]REK44139.1 MAG: amidohydrolase [Acidobacteriota bacterium]